MRASGPKTVAAAGGVTLLVVCLGALLVPARYPGAPDAWYSTTYSDSVRYIAMVNGAAAEYPWGSRWLIPGLASLFPDGTQALRALNYLLLFAGIFCVTYIAHQYAPWRAILVSWVFVGTGAAALLLFQNPYLVDSGGLVIFALVGIAYRRESYWMLTAVIVVGVTIKEVAAGFVVLLIVRKRWRELALAVMAGAVLLAYGRWRSLPGSPLWPDFSLGLVVKFAFGLGAAWILLLVALLSAAVRKQLVRRDTEYFVVTIGLTLLSLPLGDGHEPTTCLRASRSSSAVRDGRRPHGGDAALIQLLARSAVHPVRGPHPRYL